MPTLEEYQSVAPMVMKGDDFTLSAIETKLAAIPTPPDPPEIPAPTKAQKVAVFNLVFGETSVRTALQKYGGYVGIAGRDGIDLTKSQAKQLVTEMVAMVALYQEAQNAD
jgi:hypothetical protein